MIRRTARRLFRWVALKYYRQLGIFKIGLEFDVMPEDVAQINRQFERETFAALGRSRSKAGKAQKETNRKNVHEILGKGRK